ncbi:Uu.00g126740.m01.CDS01 [Anthostomella pinea]|uniref:non-specific serine/threonine protein kinase n=1 Tax=Anthostomella pinea TaxID=933095 RepID=A0AAI8YHQ3_9PEZI|nr:Uu.00g126740.m01.CDS01 [Anthostomella pinea]
MASFKDASDPFYDGGLKYELVTEMAPGVWKITRKSDRMFFLAHDMTEKLFEVTNQPGKLNLSLAGQLLSPEQHNLLEPLMIILNHENLMSIVDIITFHFSNSGRFGRKRWFTVWDYCDAGNLGNLIVNQHRRNPKAKTYPGDLDDPMDVDDTSEAGEKRPRTPPPEKPFIHLPESFCWHVLRSVLKALVWLHDGMRFIDNPLFPEEGHPTMLSAENPDWQPILHRNIRPENIFIGHPRRSEWYGACKLGNFGSAWISGHCQQPRGKSFEWPIFAKALAPPKGEFMSLGDMIAGDMKWTATHPQQAGQPYTIRSEYRALGQVMQALMYPPMVDYHWQWICTNQVERVLEPLGYSAALKNMVMKLMIFDHWAPVEGQDTYVNDAMYKTRELHLDAEDAYLDWKKNQRWPEAKAEVPGTKAERDQDSEDFKRLIEKYTESYAQVANVIQKV